MKLRALLSVIVAVSVVACSGAPAEPGGSTNSLVAASSPTRVPLLTQPVGTRGGGTAGGGGTVALDSRGCWMLLSPDGDYNIMWPEGTQWVDDADAVRLPKGDVVYPGDHITVMGAWFSGPTQPSGSQPAGQCTDSSSPRLVSMVGAERVSATSSSSRSSSGT